MTSPSDFHRLEELFHTLVELDADEREGRLDELRETEPGLHARLERLLEREEVDAERELRDVVGPLGSEGGLEAGDRLGPYRLLRELGQGGMGVVFEAEQEAPLERRVAVKLVRHGFGSTRLLERFEAERGTLARMSHPGVAQIFDAGTAPDGRPFLVMELVEGEPITRFCDERRLTTRERIRLVRQVCEAVQHAHQKGILHRDLKPGNILVSSPAGEPRTKVIDFGIAKLVDDEPDTGLTRRGEIVGTPEYMSPEQTRSGDVDTRSDVYALGVVLYELLTGRVPIDRETLHSASPVEVARLVGEEPPTPAEARITPGDARSEEVATLRRTDPGRLRRELRGDLGRILLMALRKEPERRYASVEQLSTDLARYLEGRPVIARPDSLAYRTRKLFQRHTVSVLAALLLVLGLISAAVFSTGMYLDAEAARRESEVQRIAAEQINEFLKEMLSSIDPATARGRDVSLLRDVLDDAAEKLDREETPLPPAVAADLGLTVGRTYESIGLEDEAEKSLRGALAVVRSLEPPPTAVLAEVELALGKLLRNRDQHEEAQALLRSAIERRRSQRPPDEPALAAALTALANHLEDVGGYEEATRLFEEAVEVLRSQPEPDPGRLSTTLRGYGEHLMNQRRMEEAEGPLREAVAVRRAAGEEGPTLVVALTGLARWLRWSDRLDEAAVPLHEAVEIARREMPPHHPLRLDALAELANLEQHRGAHEAAEALYRETIEGQRRFHGSRHTATATTVNNLGSLFLEMKRLDEAEPLFREATEIYAEIFGADHLWVSIARYNLARALFGLGRLAEAEAELREVLRVRTLVGVEDWQRAEVEVLLAACRVQRGEIGDAEAVITRGVEVIREHYGEETDRDDAALRALLEIYEREGRTEEARSLRRSLEPPRPGSGG